MTDTAKADKAKRKNRHPTSQLASTLGPAFDPPPGPRRRTSSYGDGMSSRQRNARGSRNNGAAANGPGQEVAFWQETEKTLQELCALINADNENLEQIKQLDARLAEQQNGGGAVDDEDLRQMEELNRKGVRDTDVILAKLKVGLEYAQVVKATVESNEKTLDGGSGSGLGAGSAGQGRGRAAAAAAAAAAAKEKEDGAVYDFDTAGDGASQPSPMGSSSRKYGERASRDKDRDREARDRGSIPPKAGSVEPAGSERSATSAAAKVKNATAATTFKPGDSVAFRPPKSADDGPADWILGEVSSIVLENKVRRYKVIDVDPDPEATEKPEYKLTAKNMIRISGKQGAGGAGSSSALPSSADKTWERGQTVLALYPNTTTFYKAEVDGMDESGENVGLQFEGDDDNLVQKVERRFVIEYRA